MANDDDGPWGQGLQVEIFHADTDRKPGDTNWTGYGFDVQPAVFSISAAVIILFVALSVLFPETAAEVYGNARTSVAAYFGWLFILGANFFILVVLYFAFSKYGQIRLGGVDSTKEFSDISWVAMLFSAGMGIGLMFFGVAEPMWHFFDPHLGAESGTEGAAEVAMAVTLFHWGFHPWAIYSLVGLSLAFFSFNRGLPLTFRSIFWPVLGERIYGWWGHLIDILTVFATLFGLTTSLGLGAMQINAGVEFLGQTSGSVPNIAFATGVQVAIIAVVTAIAVVSVALGLDRGVRRLSNLNLFLMFALLISVFLLGPTLFVLGLLPQGIGAYFGNFFDLSFFSGALSDPYFQGSAYYGPDGAGEGQFLVDWTVFYWAWWIAWSPFVGMFIARISRGRTVREFVGGVLVLPVLFSMAWFAGIGGSALSMEMANGAVSEHMFAEGVAVPRAVAFFAMLDNLPGSLFLAALAVILISTFFITSSDSGSLVIDHLTSGGKHDAPVTMRVFWAVTEGVVAATLLWAGGDQALAGLQAAAITTGLPFVLVLIFMSFSIWKGLQEEYDILQSEEFADAVEEMIEDGDVVVETGGGEVITDIHEADEPGD